MLQIFTKPKCTCATNSTHSKYCVDKSLPLLAGMKKWITINYHYMVPEVDESLGDLSSDFSSYLSDIKRGISSLGEKATPVVMGPVSMVYLCAFKFPGAIGIQRLALLEKLLPIYRELMVDIAALGAKEVQIHEPSLVFADASLASLFKRAYEGPASILSATGPDINMVSFFEDVGESNYKWLISVPGIKTVSLDFTRGDSLSLIKKYGFPADKVLGAGLIDGRHVWKVNPTLVGDTLSELTAAGVANIRIQPSSSLQFVPWNLESEKALLSHTAGPVLAYSKQKLAEIVAVAKNDISFLSDATTKWDEYTSTLAADPTVANRVAALTEADFSRKEKFEDRIKQQLPGLPILPTTTIGSFPQTKEIRSLRNQYKRGRITEEEYEAKIDQQIALMIGIQEALGLDILVHGEPERTVSHNVSMDCE